MKKGSVVVRKGKWYVVIYYLDKGMRRQKMISTGLSAKGNKKRAEKIMESEVAKYVEAEEKDATNILKYGNKNLTFMDIMRQYIETKKTTLERATVRYYLYYLGKIERFFKKTLLKDVNTYMIENFYNSLRKEGLKDISVKKYHEIIRPALRNAFKRKLIDTNPCDDIAPFKRSHFKATIYNQEELKELFEKIEGTRYELPVKVAAYYGLRKSEVLGLKWDAIDFKKKIIQIKHKVIFIYGEVIKSDDLKTEASVRTLPLVPFIEDLFLKEKAKQEQNKKTFKSVFQWENADYIMIDEVGHLLRSDNLSTRFSLFLKNNGLKHIRFHDLRHSCASLLVANGISIKQVQEWLGHANFNTTANIYTHLEYTSKLQSAETISNLLADDKTDRIKENEEQNLLDKDSKLINTDKNGLNNKSAVESNDKKESKSKFEIDETQLKIEKEKRVEIDETEYAEFLEWQKKKQDMEM